MQRQTSPAEWLGFGAILLAAALWRLVGLGAESLWTDEIAAVLVGGRSLLEVLVAIAVQDVNPPLFYSLVHCWLIGGESETWLRLLPALFGLVAVVITWRLGRRLGGRAIGLLSALLVAFSPLSIYLSRELRYHTLVTALALGTLLTLLNLRDKDGRVYPRLFFAAMLLGLYTHYFFLFLLPIALIWWFAGDAQKRPPFGLLCRPLCGALALWLPWLVIVAVQALRASYRFRPLATPGEALFELAGYFTVGHADARLPLDPGGAARIWYLLALAPFWALLVAGLSEWKKQKGARLAAIGCGLPVLTVLALGLFLPVHGHRYLLPFLPLFLIVLAFGAVHLWTLWKPLGVMAIVAVVLLMTGSTFIQRYDPHYQREDWRGLADMLHAAVQPDDALLVYNDSQAGPLRWYWQRLYAEPFVAKPLLTGDALVFSEQPPGAIEQRVDLYRTQARRLWLLDHFAHMYDPPGRARAALDQTCLHDPGYNLTAVTRIPLRVYWRSRQTAHREIGSRFAPEINFGEGGFDPLQLAGDWSHTGDKWAWLGKNGIVYLRAETPANAVTLNVWYSPELHDDEPLNLAVQTEDATLATFSLSSDQPQTLTAPLPATVPPGEIIQLYLSPSRTFDPADAIGGDDHSPKSVMVSEINLAWE